MISKNDLRNKVLSFNDEELLRIYNKLKGLMIKSPKMCREGDLCLFHLLRSEIKGRNLIT